MRPDGHRGEGPGRKKLDPCSNSSRTLWTGEAGPAEGINTQTDEAGWSDLSITHCLHFVCKCVCVFLCVYEGVRERRKRWRKREWGQKEKEGAE